MAFRKFTSRNIGTTLAPIGGVGATPDANKVFTVFGISLCNKANDTIAVDLALREGGVDTYLLSNFPIPAGETHFPIGNLQKGVLAVGDLFVVRSSAAASLDVIMNVVEGPST